MASTWSARHDQPVSVAISPAGDRVALSVGQRLTIWPALGRSRNAAPLSLACAPTPGLTWSPGGRQLVFRGDDGEGRVLDLSDPGTSAEPPVKKLGDASAVAFAPSGPGLAVLVRSLPDRMTLTLEGVGPAFRWQRTLPRNRMASNRREGVHLVWSPDGRFLACTTGTPTVWLIDARDGRVAGQFGIHSETVTGLAWIDDERILSASEDATLQIWRPDGAEPARVVETIQAAGMTFVREQSTALIWSTGGELFAWKLAGAPAQLWYRDSPSRSVAAHFTRMAVSAVSGLLALVDAGATELLLISDWDQTASAPATSTTYANAKVLLLGDSGVGKSALAMVLAGEEFRATESTHGRLIWQLPASEAEDGPAGHREVLLWDLAGQPGYRIVHQLHLAGAALAMVLFDSRSETTPLAGIRHWARAVRHAHPVAPGGLPTFLIAARIDRGGITVSGERISQLRRDFAIDEYFQTSAKEGTGVARLRASMLAAIDWEHIPTVTSTALFAAVRQFVVDQRSSGNLMTPLDELCRTFQAAVPTGLQLLDAPEENVHLADVDAQEAASAALSSVFEGCVARLESAGLVKRLKFGNYVLLQPELLDAYASAIVNAARDEPDGLGSILEGRVVELDFPVPSADRVPGGRQERLLVYATLEELIQHELVLREPTEEGVQLVFPSAYRRDLPNSEAPRGDGVVFRFEGPVDNVYATLIVRLARSGRFTRVSTWQSAARFRADVGECTVFLRSDQEGKAELSVGYDGVPDLLRNQFERFVHTHLERRATTGTVVRQRLYNCPEDGTAFTAEQVDQVRMRGRDTILCPVCEHRVSLRDDYQRTADPDPTMAAMDASADASRDTAAAVTVLRGNTVLRGEDVAAFDVFLCHNREDRTAVRALADQLRERGLRPWLDVNELRPGLPWQRAVEEQIKSIPAAAVIVGSTVGPWQNHELDAFLRQFDRRECPVIPVLLPGTERPDLPPFLAGMTWVDLAVTDPDPLDQLIWGVTGRHPNR